MAAQQGAVPDEEEGGQPQGAAAVGAVDESGGLGPGDGLLNVGAAQGLGAPGGNDAPEGKEGLAAGSLSTTASSRQPCASKPAAVWAMRSRCQRARTQAWSRRNQRTVGPVRSRSERETVSPEGVRAWPPGAGLPLRS